MAVTNDRMAAHSGAERPTTADQFRRKSCPTIPGAGGPELLLTLPEAAELLRAPVATLRYWWHLGAGPRSFRLGRRVVYRLADVRAWIEAQDHRNDA